MCYTVYVDSLTPRPLADLTSENLKAILADMGAGPGWYASRDLYDWYVQMCREAGLAPVTKRMFGGSLAKLGYRRGLRRTPGGGAVRSWLLTDVT